MFGRYRWALVLMASLFVAGAGLILGKLKEKEYLGRFEPRADFLLMDDTGDFYDLRSLPKGQRLLLVFPPDALPPELAPPFRAFAARVPELRARGIEVMMVIRGSAEIARNFKRATGFSSRLLLDPSGTVGRKLAIWPDLQPVAYWGYALVDGNGKLLWGRTERQPLSAERARALMAEAGQ